MCKQIISAFALLLALVGCGPSDGYRFDEERAEFERDELAVTLVRHPTIAALRAEAARLGAAKREDREIMAFGVLTGDGCTVHIVDPAKDYRPEWIGHEIMHCAYGRWHG